MGFNGGGLTRRGGGAAIVDKLFKMTINTTGSFFLPFENKLTNVTVNWGDGSSDVITSYNQTERTHVYATSGVYQISIDGQFGGIRFLNTANRLDVTRLDNWGSSIWETLSYAFEGCNNMVGYYTDYPTTPIVPQLYRTFNSCHSFNSPLNFDISNVTSMFDTFRSCFVFNQDISHLDTSKVTTMQNMFVSCSSFNKPITFDTSSVINMSYMFFGNSSFNSIITINTSSVANMSDMFRNCSSFNQDISGFNIISLTNATRLLLGANNFDTTNYDLLLISWAGQTHNNNVPFHAGTAQYSSGAAANARAVLIADGWTIADGGQV